MRALTSVALLSLVQLSNAGDLPADYRSSELLRHLNAHVGGLPSTFGELRKRFPEGIPLVIPDGRSLQRNKADFKDPRLVINREDRLFIGFAPRSSQAEVISWNEERGEYDFLIINDLAPGKTPTITVPDRSTCLACHQAGGPIFSRGPWDESTVSGPFRMQNGEPYRNEDGSIYQGNELYQSLVAANGGSTKFSGFDLSEISVTSPSAYDGLVRQGNARLQRWRACREMCGSQVECRAELLLRALVRVGDDGLEKLQAMLDKSWPANGFAYPSSVIPNRDPFGGSNGTTTRHIVKDVDWVREFNRTPREVTIFGWENGKETRRRETILPNGDPNDPNTSAHRVEQAIATGLQTEKGIDVTYDEGTSPTGGGFAVASTSEQQGHILDEEQPAGPGSIADPLVARPEVGAISKAKAARWAEDNAFECLGVTDFDRSLLSGFEVERVRAALATPALRALLERWPVRRGALMAALLKALGAASIPECYSAMAALPTGTEATIRRIESAVASATPPEQPQTALFQKYCASCHATDDIAKLPLHSLEALKSYRGEDGATVAGKLGSGAMPPGRRTPKPTLDERAEMLRLLGASAPASTPAR